jgi:hypothetical protein
MSFSYAVRDASRPARRVGEQRHIPRQCFNAVGVAVEHPHPTGSGGRAASTRGRAGNVPHRSRSGD